MDQIPEKFYKQLDSRELGEFVIDWIRKQESENTCIGKCVNVDLMQSSRITLNFDIEFLDKISKLGFLNQHQVGHTSSGAFAPNIRRIAEDNVTGLKMSTGREGEQAGLTTLLHPSNRNRRGYREDRESRYRFLFNSVLSLRPKSGLVIVDSDQFLGEYRGNVIGLYGQVIAVMKPEVKQRTLWVAGDSYDLGLGVKQESDLAEIRGTFARGSLPVRGPSRRYIEALIYGELTLDDVDHFLVGRRQDVDVLKNFGKSVYLTKVGTHVDVDGRTWVVEPELRNGRHTRDYLELLYPGNTALRSLPIDAFH